MEIVLRFWSSLRPFLAFFVGVLRPILSQLMSESAIDITAANQNTEQRKGKKQRKLSHEELLRLLSVFEGELQARLVCAYRH